MLKRDSDNQENPRHWNLNTEEINDDSVTSVRFSETLHNTLCCAGNRDSALIKCVHATSAGIILCATKALLARGTKQKVHSIDE